MDKFAHGGLRRCLWALFQLPLLPNPASGRFLSSLYISKGDRRPTLHRTKTTDSKVTFRHEIHTQVIEIQTQLYIFMNTRGLSEPITSCVFRHMMSFTHLSGHRTQSQDFAHWFLILQPVPDWFYSSAEPQLSNRGQGQF